MADETALIEALKAADAAGNEADAQKLASALEQMRAQAQEPQEPAFTSSSGYVHDYEAERAKQNDGGKMGFVNKSLAETLGAPVDLIASGLNKVTGGRVPKDSFGGSASIQRGMEMIGAPTPDREPEGLGENIASVVGEVAGFTVPAAALARRYRTAQGLSGNFARMMDDALVNSPVATTAIEAGGAAGAGVGRTIAQENEMGPGGQLTAEVLGGLGGSAAATRTALQLAGRGSRWALRQLFPNAEREASERIRSLVSDPKAAAQAIEDLKGTNLLPSARTGEPGLMALEKTVLDQDPVWAADVARKTSESMESLVNAIRQSGNVQNTRKFIEAKRQRLSAALDARIEKASEKATQALEALGEDATTGELGVVMREQLNEALADAKVQEQMLWQAVPQNTKVPVASVKSAYDQALKSLSRAQSDDMPAVARQIIGGADKKVRAVNLSEMDGLYKKLGEVARVARADGQRNQARIAEDLRSAILDDIGNAKGSPEVVEALQAARSFSREIAERFRKGPVGKLLETDPTGAPRVADELTLDRTAGLSGNRGRVATESLVQAVDNPQALEAVQGYLKRRFTDAVVTDGRVQPARAEAFMRQNAALLDMFPALKGQFQAARTTEDISRRVAKSSDAVRRSFQKESVSDAARFLGAPVDQEVKRIFQSPDAQKTMTEIVKMARKDPSKQALDGLKSGVTDYLLDQVTVRQLDNFGRNPVSGQALLRTLEDPKVLPALKAVYDPQELRQMRKSAELLAAYEKSAKAKGTLDNIVDPRFAQAVLDIPIRVLGAKLGSRLSGAQSAGVGLQAAQMGSSRMRRIWQRLTVGQAERIVTEAIRDPEVMRHLLLDYGKASPQQIRANERFFRNWGLSRPLELFEGEEED